MKTFQEWLQDKEQKDESILPAAAMALGLVGHAPTQSPVDKVNAYIQQIKQGEENSAENTEIIKKIKDGTANLKDPRVIDLIKRNPHLDPNAPKDKNGNIDPDWLREKEKEADLHRQAQIFKLKYPLSKSAGSKGETGAAEPKGETNALGNPVRSMKDILRGSLK